MCPFDYEIVHKNKCTFFGEQPCKTKFLDVCDELLSECSCPKDQVLGTWVLVQQYVGFISCIFKSFGWCDYNCATSLCDNRDLIQN